MFSEQLCLLPAKLYKQEIIVINTNNNVSLGLVLWFSSACVFPCIILKDYNFLLRVPWFLYHTQFNLLAQVVTPNLNWFMKKSADTVNSKDRKVWKVNILGKKKLREKKGTGIKGNRERRQYICSNKCLEGIEIY